MYETEHNARILHKVLEYLQTYLLKSVAVLYTYDSILFDVHPEEMHTIIDQLIPYCIDLMEGPYLEVYAETIKVFRPKS